LAEGSAHASLARMAKWPDWKKIEDIVNKKQFVSANQQFTTFKQAVLRDASAEEIAGVADHAPLMWEFLLEFAAVKSVFRRHILQVFQKLCEVPAWVTAWETNQHLHSKLQNLHQDLQAALAVQSKVLEHSIAPAALQSMRDVVYDERPSEVRRGAVVDEIVEEIAKSAKLSENPAFASDDSLEAPAPVDPRTALHEGIDEVLAIDSASKMDSGGDHALAKLRIGCIMCAGREDILQGEVEQAVTVFQFLLTSAKYKPANVDGVAEVMHVLMASASWAPLMELGVLREALRELPKEVRVALGTQHKKLADLGGCDAEACRMADDKVEVCAKAIAEKMQSIRCTAILDLDPPAPIAPKGGWKKAVTPTGHCYYFNPETKESVWSRPADLGGPIQYNNGQDVEVWSNGQRVWCCGRIEKVEEDGMALVEFVVPGKGVAKKSLPTSHQDLRPGTKTSTQHWSDEEQAQYRKWFDSIPGGDASGSRPSAAVASLIGRSGLPKPVLKQLWHVANPFSKETLDLEEFSRCCRLVAHCQAMEPGCSLLAEADRALRVRLREECLSQRPSSLPRLNA